MCAFPPQVTANDTHKLETETAESINFEVYPTIKADLLLRLKGHCTLKKNIILVILRDLPNILSYDVTVNFYGIKTIESEIYWVLSVSNNIFNTTIDPTFKGCKSYISLLIYCVPGGNFKGT